MKFLALLLITGGIFFWFMSRFQLPAPRTAEGRDAHLGRADDETRDKSAAAEVTPADFALLDAEAVALFLLKEVRDRRADTWSRWMQATPSVHQREVFRHLPAWILTFFQNLAEKPAGEKAKVDLHELFNEMALVEQSFKSAAQKKKAFLQWFPAQALRYVPRKYQKSLSENAKATLWAMRPDLGNFVRADEMKIDAVMEEPGPDAIEATCRELFAFPTVAFETSESEATDKVGRWVELINQLSEFSPIDSQIEQARTKLSETDLVRLLARVAHLHTPHTFGEAARKDWLRHVDPDDYFWWLSLSKQTPTWDLKNDLRPMRWAMFTQAATEKTHTAWSEEEKKKSSERLLKGFRRILNPAGQDAEREAS